MDRGAWGDAVHGVAELSMTGQLTLSLSTMLSGATFQIKTSPQTLISGSVFGGT